MTKPSPEATLAVTGARKRPALSSVGAKIAVAISGLSLVGFLIGHLAGNLTIFGGRASFNTYADKLHAIPGFVLVELGLLVVFLVHVPLAIYLHRRNRVARPHKYAVQQGRGNHTLASRTMIVTGVLLGGFIVFHVIHLRIGFGWSLFSFEEGTTLADWTIETMTHPLVAVVYAIGIIVMGIHVSHGFWSGFQSVGINTARSHEKLFRTSQVLGVVLAIGFLAVLIRIIALK